MGEPIISKTDAEPVVGFLIVDNVTITDPNAIRVIRARDDRIAELEMDVKNLKSKSEVPDDLYGVLVHTRLTNPRREAEIEELKAKLALSERQRGEMFEDVMSTRAANTSLRRQLNDAVLGKKEDFPRVSAIIRKHVRKGIVSRQLYIFWCNNRDIVGACQLDGVHWHGPEENILACVEAFAEREGLVDWRITPANVK